LYEVCDVKLTDRFCMKVPDDDEEDDDEYEDGDEDVRVGQ